MITNRHPRSTNAHASNEMREDPSRKRKKWLCFSQNTSEPMCYGSDNTEKKVQMNRWIFSPIRKDKPPPNDSTSRAFLISSSLTPRINCLFLNSTSTACSNYYHTHHSVLSLLHRKQMPYLRTHTTLSLSKQSTSNLFLEQ